MNVPFLSGVDRHHGRFGRCTTPSGGENPKHHPNRQSSDLSPQKEVIRIGNKQSTFFFTL